MQIDRERGIRLVERGQEAFFRALSAGPRFATDSDIVRLRYISGCAYPLMNGIIGTRLDGDVSSLIDLALQPFRARGLPMLWFVLPTDMPADLPRRLEEAGLFPAPASPGMVRSLDGLPPIQPPNGLEIRRVSCDDDLDAYLAIAAATFAIPDFVIEYLRLVLRETGFGREAPVWNYIGLRHGTPVACATIAFESEAAGLWNIGTLEGARGRGIGAALTNTLLHDARDRGCTTAMLTSSQQGYGIYQRLGFTECCTVSAYLYLPPG